MLQWYFEMIPTILQPPSSALGCRRGDGVCGLPSLLNPSLGESVGGDASREKWGGEGENRMVVAGVVDPCDLCAVLFPKVTSTTFPPLLSHASKSKQWCSKAGSTCSSK